MNYRDIIKSALERVISENGYSGDQHEQALTHRLACHLENSGFFNGYSIDCEYNRDGDNPKRDTDGSVVKPDIVVHTRGNHENNLIIIEAKKSKREIEEAKRNLKSHKKSLHYKHAFLVVFPKNSIQKNTIIEI